MRKPPEIRAVSEFIHLVGDLRGEEERDEQQPEEGTGIHDWRETTFGRLLPGPAEGRHSKNLLEE